LLKRNECVAASYRCQLTMPCVVGCTPVMKVVHAAGVWCGIVERSTPEHPPSTNAFSRGVAPAAIIGVSTRQGSASNPRINNREALIDEHQRDPPLPLGERG
jgi:hypothetical protein